MFIQEATQFKEDDEKVRAAAEKRNALESYVYAMKAAIDNLNMSERRSAISQADKDIVLR